MITDDFDPDDVAPPVFPDVATPTPAAIDDVVDYEDDANLPAAFQGDCGFLTGAAGSGKTFLAKALCHGRQGWTMAASTGIAAVNLGEATTINSLLGYFDEDSLRTSLVEGHIQAKLRKLRESGLERIILDEVSMVSAESLTLIMMALDEVNSGLAKSHPIGLTLVGDFLQLAPVPEKLSPNSRKSKPIQYAFESTEWPRFGSNTTTLTQIRRQADPDFIAALRACRSGDINAMLEYFGPRCNLMIEQDYPGLTIFSKNDQVDRWNELMHRKINAPMHTFPVTRDREQKSEWKKHIGKFGQEPDALQVKEGARVMVLANKILRGGYVLYANGDLGEFVGSEKRVITVVDDNGRQEQREVTCARVKLQRTQRETVIEPVVRHFVVPTGALGVKKDRYEIKGSIEYIPLRLAWASTVHKIQGLSMDHVQVAFADRFFASPAMLYVAFSRARSAEGLRLVGTPQLLRERCAVDPKVRPWL